MQKVEGKFYNDYGLRKIILTGLISARISNKNLYEASQQVSCVVLSIE